MSLEASLEPAIKINHSIWTSPRWQAVCWKFISCVCFAGINATVRYLTKTCPAGVLESELVIIFFQNVFGTVFLIPYFLKTGALGTIRYPVYHSARIILAVLGVMLWYKSLKHLPITEASALSFTGPILTAFGAWFLLKETLYPQRVLAVVLSILGAFIISRPDKALTTNSLYGLTVCLPIASALFIAGSKLITRKLGKLGEKPQVLTTYLLLFMTPCSLLFAIPEWTMPAIHHWPWLVFMGFLASLAHLSFAKAYALAEVTFLTPFGFLKFLLNVLLGYLIFKEFPNSAALWIGILTIFASIFLMHYKIPLYSEAKRLRSN